MENNKAYTAVMAIAVNADERDRFDDIQLFAKIQAAPFAQLVLGINARQAAIANIIESSEGTSYDSVEEAVAAFIAVHQKCIDAGRDAGLHHITAIKTYAAFLGSDCAKRLRLFVAAYCLYLLRVKHNEAFNAVAEFAKTCPDAVALLNAAEQKEEEKEGTTATTPILVCDETDVVAAVVDAHVAPATDAPSPKRARPNDDADEKRRKIIAILDTFERDVPEDGEPSTHGLSPAVFEKCRALVSALVHADLCGALPSLSVNARWVAFEWATRTIFVSRNAKISASTPSAQFTADDPAELITCEAFRRAWL